MRKDWSWQFAGTNQLAPKHDITFFCMDVACKYWPTLQRVVWTVQSSSLFKT
ncbi:hypothetical protein FQN60_011464 [Etheostoma spectabile]|uniref:Uncharacterized protein n=1 Tax=Etheostoma spectabile TaxID=54343 RepID=A0A5J5C7P8_9PERO|nr:hypothetical protein FQN60_011464 [Etheostoma spectabile]